MPFAAVNGIDIYFELHGAGSPLLNICGSGNDLRRAPASILPVDKVFETLSYDQRGLGQTSQPDADYTMADYADVAAALIHSVGWASCHVLGTSFGGMVALNLAARHPDLSSIMQPTLVCAGRYDDIAPMENSELMADRIPDAILQVFEGGHIYMIQDRTAFPAIIDFLQDES